jgi:hypothetical protein
MGIARSARAIPACFGGDTCEMFFLLPEMLGASFLLQRHTLYELNFPIIPLLFECFRSSPRCQSWPVVKAGAGGGLTVSPACRTSMSKTGYRVWRSMLNVHGCLIQRLFVIGVPLLTFQVREKTYHCTLPQFQVHEKAVSFRQSFLFPPR